MRLAWSSVAIRWEGTKAWVFHRGMTLKVSARHLRPALAEELTPFNQLHIPGPAPGPPGASNGATPPPFLGDVHVPMPTGFYFMSVTDLHERRRVEGPADGERQRSKRPRHESTR